MATITTRNIKGSPLTFTELDANFTNLNSDKYESGASPTFVNITATTVTLSGAATVASLASSGAITAASLTLSGTPTASLLNTTSFITVGGIKNTNKLVVTTNTLTASIISAQNTYFTGTAGASFQLTLPAAVSTMDGMIYTIMSTVARASTTWVSSGATFIGAPSALVANTPYRFQYDHSSLKWYIC